MQEQSGFSWAFNAAWVKGTLAFDLLRRYSRRHAQNITTIKGSLLSQQKPQNALNTINEEGFCFTAVHYTNNR